MRSSGVGTRGTSAGSDAISNILGIAVSSSATMNPFSSGAARAASAAIGSDASVAARDPTCHPMPTPTSSAAVPAAIAQRNRRTDAASDAAIHSETARIDPVGVRSWTGERPVPRRRRRARGRPAGRPVRAAGPRARPGRRRAPRRSPRPHRRPAAGDASVRRAQHRPCGLRRSVRPGAGSCIRMAHGGRPGQGLTLGLGYPRPGARTNVANAPGTGRKIARDARKCNARRFTLRLASRRRRTRTSSSRLARATWSADIANSADVARAARRDIRPPDEE